MTTYSLKTAAKASVEHASLGSLRFVPDAVAIEVQHVHPDSLRPLTTPEGWPEVDCVVGSLPPAPEWLPDSDRRKEYRRQWALMMVDKIVAVARAEKPRPF